MHVVWKRIKACSGRNWKYGYNALELLCFLVSAGAESALASILGHIREIYRLMHFELESTIGISKEARSKVRASARRLYGMCLTGNKQIFRINTLLTSRHATRPPRYAGKSSVNKEDVEGNACLVSARSPRTQADQRCKSRAASRS